MSLKSKRNIWILFGFLFIIIFKVSIIVPHVNILISIGCFYKAYTTNKTINKQS